MILACDLAQIGCRRTVFATDTESLHHTRKHKQHRRCDADNTIAWSQCDDQRACAHQAYGKQKSIFSSMAIGIDAHKPAAKRPCQKANGKNSCRIQKLSCLITFWKERLGKIEGKSRIDIPVIPFNQIPDRAR